MSILAVSKLGHEPLEFALMHRVALSPVALAVVVACAALAVLFGAYSISDVAFLAGTLETGFTITPQAHAAVLGAVLLGYGVGATKYISKSSSAWRAEDVVRSRWGGAAGLVIGVVISGLALASIRALEPDRPLIIAGEAALNLVFLALFWAVGRASYIAVVSILRPSTIASVDLYDLQPLYTHGREQLRVAFVWLTGASIFVFIMLFDPNPAVQVDSVKVVGSLLLAFVLLALAMILLPLRRIWLSLRTAKAAALTAVSGELRALRADPNALPGREADLLARRTYIASLSEWPFDPGSVGTFGFYILLPFFTWMSATLAKQLFDTVFMAKVVKAIMSVVMS